MNSTVTLTGSSLTSTDVVRVARGGAAVQIDPSAARSADASRAAIERVVERGEAVYGVNTGFGKLASVRIDHADLLQLQRNLIASHVAGLGDPLPVEVVRAVMLLRANVLLRETSGVRSAVVQQIVAMLNARVHPVVPEQGSVGASGDLAPLAHVAWGMMGEGEVSVDGGGTRPGSQGRVGVHQRHAGADGDARALCPRRQQPLAHGDWCCGDVTRGTAWHTGAV
jgi:histidine ammonia-lyase